jgi:hypothetical protein
MTILMGMSLQFNAYPRDSRDQDLRCTCRDGRAA